MKTTICFLISLFFMSCNIMHEDSIQPATKDVMTFLTTNEFEFSQEEGFEYTTGVVTFTKHPIYPHILCMKIDGEDGYQNAIRSEKYFDLIFNTKTPNNLILHRITKYKVDQDTGIDEYVSIHYFDHNSLNIKTSLFYSGIRLLNLSQERM